LSRQKGTTLVEVLVASTILAIVIAPVLYIMAFNRVSVSEAGCEAKAAYIIKDWFESVRRLENMKNVCAAGGNIGSRLGEDNADTVTVDRVLYHFYFDTASVTINDAAPSQENPRLLKLTANIRWQYNRENRHLEMSMLSNN